tara:strand:+ start:1471 stop:1650 length:180 start_codon:yes stop_codon:yes gene_type:complete
MEIVLTKEWIKDRKVFLSKEYIKVADDVSELRDKLIDAEDNLNDIVNELADLDSMNVNI